MLNVNSKALPTGRDLLSVIGDQSFYALEQEGIVRLFIGKMAYLETIDELKEYAEGHARPVAFNLPYRVIRERGFKAQGNEPIIALAADTIYAIELKEFQESLPEIPLILSKDIEASMSDFDYAAMVETFQEKEIEGGHCSQATLSRKFEGQVGDYKLEHILSLYRTLLTSKGQYMTVLMCDRSQDPDRPHAIIGASPERHLTVTKDHALMIPIAGTLRKEDRESFNARLDRFIEDPKEVNELFQVVDEELKMMGRICPEGGTIKGPYLREIGSVVHTEYELYGNRGLAPLDALRLTLHAPTVIGGPMESAARIIAKYEPCSRRYYAGEVGLYIPAGAAGNESDLLDCAISLRCGEFFTDGTFAIQAGGGLVRDSDPYSEAHESRAKAMGLMAFLLNQPQTTARYLNNEICNRVAPILDKRNVQLSSFWVEDQNTKAERIQGEKSILIINNEDDFSYMLAHICAALGYAVEVADSFSVTMDSIEQNIVLSGPGPGDPNDPDHPRMIYLRELTSQLLQSGKPLFGVCLGHQMICHQLGFPVKRQAKSTQGMQRAVKIFDQVHNLGFYNSFAPILHPIMDPPADITSDLDEEARIIRISGPTYHGFQFHPESVMSQTGVELIAKVLNNLS